MQKTSSSIVYLGVDIGKATHAWTLVDEGGHILEEGMVANTPTQLILFVKRFVTTFEMLIVGCEATGSYYENLAIAFLKRAISVRVINPALTSTKALRTSMRSTKTDKQDARGIAYKLQEKQGRIGTVFMWNMAERRLQAMARHLRFLKKQRSALKVRTKAMQERSFECIEVHVNLFDEEITQLECELVKETKSLYTQAMDILVSIRGVGEKSAAYILAETMCLKRFPTSKAFAAFVGLDPTLKQSGTSIHGKSRLSKAGSPYLRATLSWSAKLLVRWNETFKQCFEHAISRGKAPGVAYGIVARKFATVIHQCVTNGVMFNSAKVGTGTHLSP
jgi:transposase